MKLIFRRLGFVIGAIIVVFALTLGIMAYLDQATANQAHIYPDYPKEELNLLLNNAFNENGEIKLTPEAYKSLLYQTGLGKPAIDDILRANGVVTPEVLDQLKQFQTDFFAPIKVLCSKIGIITFEEKIINNNQEEINGFKFAKLRKGDILINKSSHSTGWRHGHNAIVIDADNQKTMEAILLGYNSTAQSMEKWRSYPSFILLRLREDAALENGMSAKEAADKAADFAIKYLDDVPYGLMAGFINKAVTPEKLKETQCAHLVWYAYYNAGFDIDSDGGWLVTPNDIANSNLLEVVQIYGVDPAQIWP